jgi:hypothetical protein
MKHSPPHFSKRRSTWALALGVVVGVAVLVVVRPWRENPDDPVREQWAALLVCVTSGREASTSDVARTTRNVELDYLTHADPVEGERQRKVWLDRCEAAAAGLLVLLSRRSSLNDPRWTVFRDLVDEVKDSLRSKRLPSPETMVSVAREAESLGLTTTRITSGEIHREGPLLSLDQLPRESLANGRFSLVASDPVPSRDVHVLLEQPSGGRACIFLGKEPSLSAYRCTDVGGAPEPDARWRWESPNELEADFLTRTRNGQSAVYRFDAELVALGSVPGEMLGVVGTGTDATLLVASGGESLSMYSLQPRSTELVKRTSVPGLSWVVPFGDEVIWAAPAAGSQDQDRVRSVRLDSLASIPAGEERGNVFENAAALACESGDTRAVLVLRSAGRTAHSWEREAFVLLRDANGWSPAVSTAAAWNTVPSAGVAYVGAPTFTCRHGEATVTWAEGDDQNVIRQLRCTRDGCVTKGSRLRGSHRGTLLADLDGKVLMVRTDTEHHIVRMRLASIDDLATTRDAVLYDEQTTFTDESPSMALHSFVRGSTALLLLRIARDDRADVFAVRVDTAGHVMLAQPSPP